MGFLESTGVRMVKSFRNTRGLFYLLIYLSYLFFPMAREILADQGLLLVAASASHSGTSHPVGHLWTSDQPVVETTT